MRRLPDRRCGAGTAGEFAMPGNICATVFIGRKSLLGRSENSEASGHLYEIPHVAKAAECVTLVLQEEGKGAP
jgi:hypothetical protein